MPTRLLTMKTASRGAAVLVMAVSAYLGGCLGSYSPDGGTPAGAPGPSVPAPIVSAGTPITAVADAGGGQITVTAANTLAAGDILVISGTASYNGTYTVVSATPTSFVVTAAFAGTETGLFQAGGGMISGCSTTTSAGAGTGVITFSTAPSRYSGVAPLAIFFDATGTTSTGTSRPFHELEYRWNFGDPGSGNWGYGARAGSSSRNSATGAVAAHIFETPGVYTVGVTVTDGTNAVSNACVQIAVQSADTVFSGTNTICLSKAGNFGGCPAGAQNITYPSGDFVAALTTYAGTGKRVLLRAGETWAAGSLARISANGPGILGSYPVGSSAAIQATGGTEILAMSSATTPGIKDWRVMDLEFDGLSSATATGLGASGGIDQLTLLRLNFHDMRSGIQVENQVLDSYNNNAIPSQHGHTMFDQTTIADSSIQRMIGGLGGIGAFVSGQRMAIMGNLIDDTTATEHDLRVTFMDKGVISNNTLSRPAATKHVLKLHDQGFATATSMTFGRYTQLVEISDNKFGPGDAWTVAIAPQNGGMDERIRNIMVERNWFVAGTGTGAGLVLSASEVSYNNNICDMTGVANPLTYATCVRVELTGIEPAPNNMHIRNNTFYRSDAGIVRGVYLDANTSTVQIANNLLSGPNTSTTQMLLDAGAAGVVQTTNVSDNALTVFSVALPATTAQFMLSGGNVTARNQGTAVPVFSDFFRNDRPLSGTYDVGATEQ